MSSTWDSFFAATSVLASSGPIKNRLSSAYGTYLASLDHEQLPNEIREDFCSLSNSMSRVQPLRGESAINATVRKMSDADAGRVALRIVNMMAIVARLQAQPRAPMLRAVGDD